MGILEFDINQEGKRKVLPKKPKQTTSDSTPAAFSDELFSDYSLETSWEDALMMASVPEQSVMNTPEPMMVEENPFNTVWEIDVQMNHYSAVPMDSFLIAENNNESEMFTFPKEASEDLDDCWGYGSFHAPAAMVEGINIDENAERNNNIADNKAIKKDTVEIDLIYNMDIVQFALGESGLDGFLINEVASKDSHMVPDDETDKAVTFQDLLAIQPVATTTTFIHPSDNLLTIDPTAISLHLPNLQAEAVVAKRSKPSLKRSVGRPERQTPLEITEVPRKGSVCLTPDQMRSLKYRRMRDLNNEASKKCRKNRKVKQSVKEQSWQELEEKNRMLKEKMLTKESEVAVWRAKCRAIGYSL
eukprot:GFUD01027428.1.p1 GENE.GFUD01027428.1~~GFUD01027428.1.p1  ORF type:complete len:359 (+),score=124.76 GFUD01027428.1:158-1234(+)